MKRNTCVKLSSFVGVSHISVAQCVAELNTNMTSVDERADAQETFNLFDKDQDGKISLDELRTAMMAICGRATEEDIARILKVELEKKRLKIF